MKQTQTKRGLVKTCFHCNLFDTSRCAITHSAKAISHAKICTQGKLYTGPKNMVLKISLMPYRTSVLLSSLWKRFLERNGPWSFIQKWDREESLHNHEVARL